MERKSQEIPPGLSVCLGYKYGGLRLLSVHQKGPRVTTAKMSSASGKYLALISTQRIPATGTIISSHLTLVYYETLHYKIFHDNINEEREQYNRGWGRPV